MRITNSILQRTTLNGVQRNLREIAESEGRIASKTRIQKPSDDPGAAGSVLRTDGKLRALEQYQRNIGSARTRLSLEENVLDQLGDLLTRGRELALAQAGSTANAETREIAAKELELLIEKAIQLGNTEFDGLYLFGGADGDVRPFKPDGSPAAATGPRGTHQTEISTGHLARLNHDGGEVFIDSNALASLQALFDALGAGDGAAITAAGHQVELAFSHVQMLLGEVGARTIQLDIAESNIEALDINLRTFRSDLADVEFEEEVTRLVGRQTALQAAYMATSRILQTTLTDYLR